MAHSNATTKTSKRVTAIKEQQFSGPKDKVNNHAKLPVPPTVPVSNRSKNGDGFCNGFVWQNFRF